MGGHQVDKGSVALRVALVVVTVWTVVNLVLAGLAMVREVGQVQARRADAVAAVLAGGGK